MPAEAGQAAAVRLLHPGPGTVAVAEGASAARAMPGVEAVALRVGPGDMVGIREGTGQEVGHVLVTGATAAEAEARLAEAVAAIRLEVLAD
jgi:biotin carboxylase